MTNGPSMCIMCHVAEVSNTESANGSIAQLGEHLPYKQEVTGSSPVVPTISYGPVVQSVSTPACHAGGRRFESVPGRQEPSLWDGSFSLYTSWTGKAGSVQTAFV